MRNMNSLKLLPSKPQLNLNLGALNLGSLKLPTGQHAHRRNRSYSKPKLQVPPSGHVAALQTSFSVTQGLRQWSRHQFRVSDLQYVLLALLWIFSMWIVTVNAPLLKIAATCGYLLLLLMPATRQFFLPSLPIWMYLVYFFSSRFIPDEYRPHIWVKVLPALENVLYGANISNIMAAHPHPILDLLAWIPYGLGHFGFPAICSVVIFVFAAPGTLPVFAITFGWLNTLGTTLALLLPCAPPWYENLYGLAPAHYGMKGNPAGLARVDALFGFDMYTTNFSNQPNPFGAFPSMHAGDATFEALIMSYCFPRFRPFFLAYIGWMWWATMYLNHHYAVDLVGGSLIASIFFFTARSRWLPRQQPDKKYRWQYDFVEVGQLRKSVDEEYGYSLGLLDRGDFGDSDQWSLGSSWGSSSSTVVSGSSSPVTPVSDWESAESEGRRSNETSLTRESDCLTEVVIR